MTSDIIPNLILMSFIILCGLLVIGSLYWNQRKRRITSSIFDNLALRYGGRVEIPQSENNTGGEYILHSLKFPYGNTQLIVKDIKIMTIMLKGVGTDFQTCFEFKIDMKKEINFIIRRRYRAIDISAGMRVIHFENKEFEREFHVEGINEALILQLLTSTLQDKIMKIRGVNVIKFWSNSFQLIRSNRLRNEEEYEQYIELTKSFYDRMIELLVLSS